MPSLSLVPPESSSSQSSMLDVEGSTTVAPPGTDHQATHHICVGNLSIENVQAVLRLLRSSGRIKTTYPDLLLGPGILMVTFYDLREAAVALESINSSEYQERVRATYISDVQLATLSNTPPQDSRSARTVIVTLCGAHDRLVEFNYKEVFDTWGATRSMIEMGFSGSRRTFEVEFFDQRVAFRVTAELHNHAYQLEGISFHVCNAWLGPTRGNAFTPFNASGAVHARQTNSHH
ncbi:hypothetical protein BDB00DRAFT_846482 [Zychaea mexicana]|uniref:uncharacterized protein n=1 Tax=Zychaea mexicana TaxID=64656 RepID=UPI0022FE9534|nr:uncharacterized protein BDB00DRAFT_846482 [Zychaea mexicana]KAI9488780.1 hypothetical protein BDB00DRAFT_846482 [Zychaea mexicana]